MPICRWRPFGGTPAEHTDLEVRIHAGCRGHGLRYRGFTWDCVDGCTNQPSVEDRDGWYAIPLLTQETSCTIDYGGLDYEKRSVSENATRSIFGWLRVGGYAVDEKEIWQHEWFEPYDFDEECEEQDLDKSEKRSMSRAKMWLEDQRTRGQSLAACS